MKRIADYQTLELLGAGSQGEVWLAVPPARLGLSSDRVAVKLMNGATTDHEFQLVLGELKVYASAPSSHLVALYDAGRWGERLFIAQEYFPIGALAEARQLDARAASRAIADAARGAHALHEVGIVHRHIKSANILLTDADGGAKLGDLGLAHVVSPGQTVTGTATLGSVEFMEPGVVRGERAARASDIWSLGVSWHQALTGQSPYGQLPEGNLLAVLKHVINSSPQLSQDMPPERLEIIRRCLAPDRADRYPTALALAEEIERVEGLVTAR
jgi:serine/threonine protein kinase